MKCYIFPALYAYFYDAESVRVNDNSGGAPIFFWDGNAGFAVIYTIQGLKKTDPLFEFIFLGDLARMALGEIPRPDMDQIFPNPGRQDVPAINDIQPRSPC